MRADFLEDTLWNSQLIVPSSAFDGPKHLYDKVFNRYTTVAEILLMWNPVNGNSISKTNVQKP